MDLSFTSLQITLMISLLAAHLTLGNTDGRKPVRKISKGLLDNFYADKGYISKALTDDLKEDAVKENLLLKPLMIN